MCLLSPRISFPSALNHLKRPGTHVLIARVDPGTHPALVGVLSAVLLVNNFLLCALNPTYNLSGFFLRYI